MEKVIRCLRAVRAGGIRGNSGSVNTSCEYGIDDIVDAQGTDVCLQIVQCFCDTEGIRADRYD